MTPATPVLSPNVMPRKDVIALLKELVRIPSLSGEEKNAAGFMEEYVARHGMETGRIDDNVFFGFGEGDDVLLLNTHLDTVPPSEHHPHGAFDAIESEGCLYGRGSVDAKASVAAMTTALLSLAADGFRPSGRIIVALTACEETGGDYNGLNTLRPYLPDLTAALVGEPTNLVPCIAQKGLLVLRVEAQGKTAHAARAHLGENAIAAAAKDIERAMRLVFDRTDTILGCPTVTVTTITGGSARNVVPDRCSFTLDIRSTPVYTHKELIGIVQDALESEVHVHSERIVPVATDANERIVRACLRAIPDVEPIGSPTASDWIFLADVPTVKIGPGSSRLSHTPEEHIPIAEVQRAVEVYRSVIEAYFEP